LCLGGEFEEPSQEGEELGSNILHPCGMNWTCRHGLPRCSVEPTLLKDSRHAILCIELVVAFAMAYSRRQPRGEYRHYGFARLARSRGRRAVLMIPSEDACLRSSGVLFSTPDLAVALCKNVTGGCFSQIALLPTARMHINL
jgi:hypothetical protein